MIRNACLTALTALTLAACNPSQPPVTPETGETAAAAAPAAVAPAAMPTTAASPLIVTAQGWGPLSIGMTRAQVVEALGEDANPNAVGGAEPGVCDQFRPARAPEGVMVMLENGRLSRISLIRGSDLKTDRDFGIGSSADEIKAAYGNAARVTPHKYSAAPAEDIFVWASGVPDEAYVQDPDARGIRYEIGSDGNVSAVHAGGPSIQLVEGCS